MSRLEANMIIICLLEFVENNVGNVWIIGVIDEFRRKKCIVVVSMEVGLKIEVGMEAIALC